MSDLLVCTADYWRSDQPSRTEMLEESCRFYGLEFDSWGVGEAWVGGGVYGKIHGMINFLETVSHPYVLYTDGYDSWMLAGEKAILKAYHSFEKPVVVCGHQHMYPNFLGRELGLKQADYPESPTRFRFVCAGQFMGEREALQEALCTLGDNYKKNNNDQGAWNMGIATGLITDIAEVDYECNLFLTMTSIPHEKISFDSEKRAVFQETGGRPIAIHFGGGKGGSPNDVNMKSFYQTWLQNR